MKKVFINKDLLDSSKGVKTVTVKNEAGETMLEISGDNILLGISGNKQAEEDGYDSDIFVCADKFHAIEIAKSIDTMVKSKIKKEMQENPLFGLLAMLPHKEREEIMGVLRKKAKK